jgi:hypothetical protein
MSFLKSRDALHIVLIITDTEKEVILIGWMIMKIQWMGSSAARGAPKSESANHSTLTSKKNCAQSTKKHHLLSQKIEE